MRRVAAAVAAAGAIALSVTAAAGGQEAAASISDVGWWSSNPAATSPERGLAVSAGPNGNISVSAIRVMLIADAIETAKLTLPEEGGVGASGAQLQVCPTPNAWTSGPKQTMDKAPKPECDRLKVALARGGDGNWTADVSLLLKTSSEDETEVSLMVVPANTGVPQAFEVRFRPPAIEATGTSDSGSGSGSSSDSSSFSDFGSGSDSSSSGFSSTPDTFSAPSSSSFADSSPLPSLSSAQTSGTFESTPTASDAAAGEVTAAAPPPTAGASAPVAAAPRPVSRGSRAGQALFFVLVSTVIGVGAGVGHARFRPASSALA